MIKRFENHKKAQCYIIAHDEDNKVLISYTTAVIEIVNGWFYVNGLYSRTTIKHIGWFMHEELGMSYQLAKQLYTDGMRLNIHTGEVEEIED